MFFRSVQKNPVHITYDGEDRDELIYYIFRRSFLTNYDWVLLALAVFVTACFLWSYVEQGLLTEAPVFFSFTLRLFFYLISFGIAFQGFLNWYFNVFIVTSKKIVDVDFHGLLYKNISVASINSIEDVTSNISGSFGVIFNIGSVYVQTAAEKREFEFAGAADPAKMRDMIDDIVTREKHHGSH